MPPEGEENIPESEAAGGGRHLEAIKPLSLLPDSQFGYTQSGHPTIFVYVPKTKYRNRKVFFGIQDEDWNSYYHVTFEISGDEGIVAIALPEDLPELEKGKRYRWHFTLFRDRPTPGSGRASGEIIRLDPPPIDRQPSALDLAALYARRGFWYDALKALWSVEATGDLKVEDNWQEVLVFLGLERFASKPLKIPN